jgi:4a-hydroxytetrahydrobiopterin dehydratase
MSEEGWREFLAADGLDDWVVLHSGATAVYPTSSMSESAHAAVAIADVPGIADSDTVVTVAAHHLSVRISRDIWRLETEHIALARGVSAAVQALGLRADRSRVQELQFAVAARPDEINVGFWRAVLGYVEFAEDHGADPLGHGSTVWMQGLDPDRPLRHAMHLDVSVAREQVAPRVAAALAAGGRIIDESEEPASWILADAAGNRVCVTAWPDGAEPTVPPDGPVYVVPTSSE